MTEPSRNAPYPVDAPSKADVRDAPKLVECNACSCSLAGHASPRLVEQFTRTHEGHEQ